MYLWNSQINRYYNMKVVFYNARILPVKVYFQWGPTCNNDNLGFKK